MAQKPDRRTASTEVRLGLRRRLVMLRGQGTTHAEIAQITGYRRPYVTVMLERLPQSPELLEGVSRGGRPRGSLRALSAEQAVRVQELIRGKCPDQLSLPSALWTLPAIRETIRRTFDLRLSKALDTESLTPHPTLPRDYARPSRIDTPDIPRESIAIAPAL